jgi:hypothetical protein
MGHQTCIRHPQGRGELRRTSKLPLQQHSELGLKDLQNQENRRSASLGHSARCGWRTPEIRTCLTGRSAARSTRCARAPLRKVAAAGRSATPRRRCTDEEALQLSG